jgi:hypothetical protein
MCVESTNFPTDSLSTTLCPSHTQGDGNIAERTSPVAVKGNLVYGPYTGSPSNSQTPPTGNTPAPVSSGGSSSSRNAAAIVGALWMLSYALLSY